jgi:hypothetical protein
LETTKMDFLAVARREIEAGIPVIPVKTGQKQPPLVAGGTSSASTDPEQVARWAAQFPDANVGVVCRLDGILIVDDDEGIIEESGIPVRTRVVESSPGHKQYYFKHTAATAAVSNLPQRDGFSLRSHNYYGLAAGSLHPDGHFYRLLIDAPIQPMSEELLRYLQDRHDSAKRNRLASSSVRAWGPLTRKIGEGEGRNDDMTRLAGLIWDGEISEGEFVAELGRACAERHDPPYPEERITDLVRRAMRDWKPSPAATELRDSRLPEYGFWMGPKWFGEKDDYFRALGQAVHEVTTAAKEQVTDDNWRGIFHTYLDFVNAPELSFAIRGWLQQDGLTMIGGLAGHGKTWIMLQMVRSLLTGEPLFEHEYFSVTQKAERVVYLVPEVSIGPFKYRLEKTRLMEFVRDGKLLVRTLSSAEDVPLSDPRIRRAAAGADVFLDTAIRFMEGDEKSAEDAKRFAATLFAIQKAGARTVTGAHHSPKSLKGDSDLSLENVLRGSGDIGAMLATCWGVWSKDEETNRVYVKNVKARDFEPVRHFEIQGRPHIDETGQFKMVCEPGMSDGKSRTEGNPGRSDKLNILSDLRDMMGKPGKAPSVREMIHRLNEKRHNEKLEPVPEGTAKTYITQIRRQLDQAHPNGNSARL